MLFTYWTLVSVQSKQEPKEQQANWDSSGVGTGALTAVDLVRLVHAVVVPIAHPLSRDAASIPTAVLFREVAV